MSDEEVDLNAMIQRDRKRQFEERQKRRQQRHTERRDHRDSRRDNDHHDRSRDDRRNDRRDRRDNEHRNDRRRESSKRSNELVIQSYAISATGFVSDVSLDDILKLTKGKKVINIKAFYQREDGKPLQPEKDKKMSVIINFVEKEDANEFVKEYTDKMLDGQNPLVFQFRRGIVSRQPKRKGGSESEDDGSEGNAKSEEDK